MPEPTTANDTSKPDSGNSSGHSWLRRTGIGAAIVLLALCLIAIAGWIFRTTVAEWLIAAYLKSDDVTKVSLTVDAVETDHVLIRDLRISGKTPVSVARIRLDYRIDEFFDGRIKRLAVIDIRSIRGDVPIEIDQIVGDGTFTAGFDGLTTLIAGIDVIRARVGTQQFEPGRIDIYYRDRVLSLDASITGPPGHVTLIAKGTLDPGPDPFHWFLSGRLDAAATTALLEDRIDGTGKVSFSIFGDVDDPLFFTGDEFAENPSLPKSLSMDGEINVSLDRLVVGGDAWPVDGHQRLIFGVAKLSGQTTDSATAFDATLMLDKRQTPNFGFDQTDLNAAGTLELSGDRLTILLADGPLLRVQNPRVGPAGRIPGDLTLTLSGEANRIDATRPAWTVSHHLNGHVLWKDSDIALLSSGSFSDSGDPVVFTLRGAFDATPFLANWEPGKTAKGKGNIFIAGRVSQPLPPRGEPSQPDEPWPGEIRLDGAFGLETAGIRLPGSTDPTPVKDKLEISLKGFNGGGERQQGRLGVNAMFGKRTVDEATLGETKLNIQGRVVHDAQGYQFLPTFDSALSLQSFTMANGSTLPNGLTLQLSGDDNKVSLSPDFADLRYSLAFAHLEADGTIVDKEQNRHTVRLTIPSLAGQSAENGNHTVRATDATIDLPTSKLTVRDIDATANGKDRTMTFSVQAGDIRHHATPPLTTPLSATAKGRVEGDAVRADINAQQRFGPLKLDAVVKHDIAAQAGRVDFNVPKFELGAKSHSLAEAFPPASKWLTDAEGGAGLDGHLLWDREVVSGQMTVSLDKLSITSEQARLSDLTGTINFIELVPLAMPPRQRIIGNVTVGEVGPLPARVEFQLREDGSVDIQDLDLEFAGGHMRTRGRVRPGGAVVADADLQVESIDLAQLFRMMGIEGLDGTGRIGGKIPIQVRGSDVTIKAGRLQAEGDGTLRYSGTALQKQLSARGDTVATVMQVLSDFRYNKLTMDLNKSADGEGSILMRLEGNNPAVYEGHPFAFNINIESNFDKLGRIALGGIQALADALRKTERAAGAK